MTNGDVQGRFVHNLRPATQHILVPMPGSPGYCDDHERLETRKEAVQRPAVLHAHKRRSTITERIARIRSNSSRISDCASAENTRAEDNAELRNMALARQKIKYLKSVSVAAPSSDLGALRRLWRRRA